MPELNEDGTRFMFTPDEVAIVQRLLAEATSLLTWWEARFQQVQAERDWLYAWADNMARAADAADTETLEYGVEQFLLYLNATHPAESAPDEG